MGWFRGRRDSALNDVAAEMRNLRDLLETRSALQDNGATQQTADSDLVLRLESLEGRFEELRGQCLRHLQMASQRLKLAERKEEEMEDAGELEPGGNGAQMTFPMQPEPEPQDDMEWARAQLRARGETPITGA